MADKPLKIEGIKATIKGINLSNSKTLRAARAAVQEEAEDTLQEIIPITPYEKGDLRRSLEVEEEIANEYEVMFSIGSNLDYAARQHEDTDPPMKHKPGTQAKFIEIPVRARGATFEKNVASRIRRRL